MIHNFLIFFLLPSIKWGRFIKTIFIDSSLNPKFEIYNTIHKFIQKFTNISNPIHFSSSSSLCLSLLQISSTQTQRTPFQFSLNNHHCILPLLITPYLEDENIHSSCFTYDFGSHAFQWQKQHQLHKKICRYIFQWIHIFLVFFMY